MKPDPQLVLAVFGEKLASEVAPLLTGFHANSVSMIAAMLAMMSEEWDRAASRLVEENAAVRAIFRDAERAVPAGALRDRLAALARQRDEDFRISALEAANVELRTVLIELHAYLEDDAAPAARALEEAIWAEIARSVERRRVSLANF